MFFSHSGSRSYSVSLQACNLGSGYYSYIADLLGLAAATPAERYQPLPVPLLSRVTSPLILPAWQTLLQNLPDRSFSNYITAGIRDGFRIGFSHHHSSLSTIPSRNLRSASEHPAVIQAYLNAEIAAGRVVGPMPLPLPPSTHISPFGVIPKKHQPNKWRLIVDLSSPLGRSINDGILSSLCSVRYAGIDEALSLLRMLGPGAWLAKLDIMHAYRIVPIHPDDRPLLGMSWQNHTFIDTCLPFGLCSAPKIFSALADALMWIMLQQGITSSIHYLDDFLFASSTREACLAQLQLAMAICDRLGVPIAPNKVEGPATSLTFLGIEFDTIKGELRLPDNKLVRARQSISQWVQRKACNKRELLSLLGELHHFSYIVRPGRPFLRHLIELSKLPRRLDHQVRLSLPARSDIMWWHTYISLWNGRAFFPLSSSPEVTLTTDASGSWGCGALLSFSWFQFEWRLHTRDWHICAQELFPIVLAAATWGPEWHSAQLSCNCDNEAVVYVINKGSARDPIVAHLLRCLFFYAAHYHFSIRAVHIAGQTNILADALSRNNLAMFFSSFPQASPYPTPVSPAAIAMAVSPSLDWTSPDWKQLFLNSLSRV